MISTIRLYIHQKPGEPQQAITCDMSSYPSMYGALLGVFDVQVEWPEIQADPTAALIDHYERQIVQEQADHLDRMAALMEQVHNLRSIEFKPSEFDE